MGLFDIFKKKDAAFYLNRARKGIERGQWVYARDDAQEGLELSDVPPDVEAGLREAFTLASSGLCQINIDEARLSLEAGEFARTKECLDTARNHAPDDEMKKVVEALAAALRDAKKKAKGNEKDGSNGQGRTGQDAMDAIDEEFNVHLAGLEPDVAAIYADMGPHFAKAYVELNAGKPGLALAVLSTLKPGNEEVAALVAFEMARALIMKGDAEQALNWLDVAGALRGSEPIFLTDHPSIAYLRFEALMNLGRKEEAADALREGLEAQPNNDVLRTSLAALLLSLKKFEEAEPLVTQGLACNRSDPQSHILKARLLSQKGDRGEAIEVLEDGIKSCGCNPSALPHPLLARELADLYISEEKNPQRADTLLFQLFQAQQGEVEWFDHFLRARYYKWQGDPDAARISAKKALDALPDIKDPRRKHVEALMSD